MRRTLWLSALLYSTLAVLLTGCELPSTHAKNGLTTPEDRSAGPVVLGLESVEPLPEYKIALHLSPETRRLDGEQHVQVPNRTGKELGEIVFRLYPNLPQFGGLMAVDQVWVDGQPTQPELRGNQTVLSVPLAQPSPPEASVGISLTFNIDIPHYNSGYVLFGHSQGIWSLPDAYALLAVHDGVGWREDQAPIHGDAVFADVALYDVTLILPPSLVVASTGSVQSEALNQENQQVHKILGRGLREFAWLASDDYLVDETEALGTTVRSFYLPNDETAGKAAMNIATAALRVYTDAFGAYPFPEMLVVEAPLIHFGMEFPGMSLIGVDLYREHRAQLEDRIAHEVAHQWWYSMVGNDPVNTPWLDEGLAEFSTAIYYQDIFGEARANTLVNQRWLVPYQAAVDSGYDAVVNQPSAAFDREYETVVYAKAALFFDALRKTLGDDATRAILREYVKRYRWRIATPEGFLQVAEATSGQDLGSLFNRWILSAQ